MRIMTSAMIALAITIAKLPAMQDAPLPLQAGLAEVEITPPLGYRKRLPYNARISG